MALPSFFFRSNEMKIILLTLIAFLSINRAFAESGWSGNGGDGKITGDNIWNLGQAVVPYCINVAPDFPLQKDELSQLVKESFEEWIQFFNKYDLNSKHLIFKTPETQGFLPSVSLDFSLQGSCGDVLLTHQVQFLFGIKNDIIKSYTQFSDAELKFGAAIRPNYNHKTYRNGGYIWISNFSSDRNKMKHIILHEIGHILGIKHDLVFVMDESIGDMLTSNLYSSEDFGHIEHSSWPFILRVGDKAELTTPKGRVARNDGRETRCEGLNYMPNRILPPALLKRLNLLPRGCHKFVLTFESESESEMFKIFSLAVVTPQGQKMNWRGEFIPVRKIMKDTIFPSVFTSLNGFWGKGISSEAKQDLPAKGFLLINGEKVAAQIELNKGISFELFFPETGRWFMTSTY